jgi:hypothetical protein
VRRVQAAASQQNKFKKSRFNEAGFFFILHKSIPHIVSPYFYICVQTINMMKKILVLFCVLFVSSYAFAQKKEKVKGSRIVTTAQKDINNFDNLEVEDNIEVFLQQGDNAALEIEADDNLHEIITIEEKAGGLRVSLSKEFYGAKKVSVKITYTSGFKMLVCKDDTYVTALGDIVLDDFTIKSFGASKVFATVRSKIFMLMSTDKSKAELNVAATDVNIELSKTSQLKALLTATKLKFDMYQKSLANIEGDTGSLTLRLDTGANFTGKNLTAKNADIITEGNANGSINVTTAVAIEASGTSELELFGSPKISIRKFDDAATLRKKILKP